MMLKKKTNKNKFYIHYTHILYVIGKYFLFVCEKPFENDDSYLIFHHRGTLN